MSTPTPRVPDRAHLSADGGKPLAANGQGTAPRVAYVTMVFSSSEGVYRKLLEQAQACRRLGLPFDIVWISTERNTMLRDGVGIRTVPIRHQSKLQFRIRQVREFNRITSEYDAVFLRYPTVDPILLALCSPRCLAVSEHHTKELEEMKLARDWRYPFEKFGARHLLRRFAGISAVTSELLDYELGRLRRSKPTLLTPNCIDVSRFASLNEKKRLQGDEKIRLVMTCAQFVPWHGLDRVLEGLRAMRSTNYELHLCGALSPEQKQAITRFPSVIHHGSVSGEALARIYEQCDVGLSCFALERKGMTQAASLKVREYLACGLPAAYGHHDPAFPKEFPYVREQAQFDLEDIRSWLKSVGHVHRGTVSRASLPFISIESYITRQYEFAQSLLAMRKPPFSAR